MRYCLRCCYPENTKPSIIFDEEGICSGCRTNEQRDKHVVDWDTKKEELKQLLESYKEKARQNGSPYDCIIPISGGKDSHYQAHLITQVFKLKPLFVAYNHGYNSKLGMRNLSNMIEKFGCDLLRYTTNPITAKNISKFMLKKVGDITWHYHAGIMTFPIQTAVRYKTPLIIWGEHGIGFLFGMYNLEDKILGYIPSGTANILKYEAKIPEKADYILNFLTLSKVKKINLVQINENYFFLMAGIGFDAKIVASINTKIKKYLGKIIFFLKGIQYFLFLKNTKIEVEINSEKIVADWVLCTNSKYYAGPYSITNETNIFEDKIITYIFKNLTRLNLLYYVWLILTKGDLASAKGVIKKDLDKLKIVGINNRLLYQIDGEDCGHHNLIEIRKSEKSINLLVP